MNYISNCFIFFSHRLGQTSKPRRCFFLICSIFYWLINLKFVEISKINHCFAISTTSWYKVDNPKKIRFWTKRDLDLIFFRRGQIVWREWLPCFCKQRKCLYWPLFQCCTQVFIYCMRLYSVYSIMHISITQYINISPSCFTFISIGQPMKRMLRLTML